MQYANNRLCKFESAFKFLCPEGEIIDEHNPSTSGYQISRRDTRFISLSFIRPKKKKKIFVCPFPTHPKFWKIRVIFLFIFFLFFIFILNFAFLNKIVKTKCQNTY